jgi:hypothetical protein
VSTPPRAKIILAGELPPQTVAPMQTLRLQQLPTMHTSPVAQSELDPQSGRPEQGVEPSTQKPVVSVVLPHTQEPPAPQAVKVSQVSAAQVGLEQAPLAHTPEAHCCDALVSKILGGAGFA